MGAVLYSIIIKSGPGWLAGIFETTRNPDYDILSGADASAKGIC